MNQVKLTDADKRLIDIIRMDTTNGVHGEEPVVMYMKKLMDDAGIETKVIARGPERPNMMATIPSQLPEEKKLPTLLIYGHSDVVSVEGQDWSHEPFSGDVEDGYIWGRGAIDMKGELAMFAETMLHIKKEGIKLPFDLKFLVVSDEEGTSEWGMKYLVENHPEIFDGIGYALGEVGGFSMMLSGKKLYPVMIAEKQFSHIKITAKGEGGHGSFAHKDTAMERLSKAVYKLSITKLPVRITPPVRNMVESIATAVGGVTGFALRLLLKPFWTEKLLSLLGEQLSVFDPLLHNNLNVTIIEGGTAINVIPSEVSCQCDLRLVPGCTMEEALRDVKNIIGDDFDIEVIEFDKGADKVDLVLIDELYAALKRKDPEAVPVPLVVMGVTDGRYISRLGIQNYGFTPMDLPEDMDFVGMTHNADEKIPVGAVDFGRSVLVDFIVNGYEKALTKETR